MKCRSCGYVSFDEAATCKKCGAAVEAQNGYEAIQETTPESDLFGPRREKDEEEPPEQEEQAGGDGGTIRSAEEGSGERAGRAVELPEMHIDFDAEVDAAVSAAPDAAAAAAQEPGRHEVIDDDTELPDSLWLEESAGFMVRLAAFAVDGLVLAALLGLFGLGAMVALGPGKYGLEAFGTPGVFIAFYLLALLLSLGYFTFFLGWMGRTPGKALLKLDVRRSDGAPMSYSRAFLRWAGYLVSLTVAGLGFLWIIFDERKKGWHDYLSGTWVKDLRHEG